MVKARLLNLHFTWAACRAALALAVTPMPTRRAALGLLAAGLSGGGIAGVADADGAAPGEALAAAARRQIGVTTGYDPAYRRIAYPWGDPPRATGVCADVVVRAARDAWGLDLQKLVHQDMAAHFGAYPHRWGLAGPDPNIDHRRVPNLETYWARRGAVLWRATSRDLGFDPHGRLAVGDILTWRSFLRDGPHVAVVTDVRGLAAVTENYGFGVHEDPLALHWLDGLETHVRWRPGDGPHHSGKVTV